MRVRVDQAHTTSKENTRVSTAPALDPAHTALLVMDYQPAILAVLAEDRDCEALLDRVEGAIADVRANGGTIAYVRVGFTDADWDAIPAANKSFAPLAQHRVMHHEDPATAIHDRLAPQDGDITVRKIRYGGISTTDLDQQLRERGITNLVVSGISTSGVVLSTVIDAADRDYQLYVLSDCVADPDTEVHNVLLHKVLPSRAHIIDTAELHALRRGGRPARTPMPAQQQPGALRGRLPHPPPRVAATASAGVTASGTLRAGDQCKRHRRDCPGGDGHPHRVHTSPAASGSRSGRRPPGRSGSWKEYRPSMLMWCLTNGERRATSLSRTSKPSARSWFTAASMYRVAKSTRASRTRPRAPIWSYPN
jgi:nicotinamidase-related amidase